MRGAAELSTVQSHSADKWRVIISNSFAEWQTDERGTDFFARNIALAGGLTWTRGEDTCRGLHTAYLGTSGGLGISVATNNCFEANRIIEYYSLVKNDRIE